MAGLVDAGFSGDWQARGLLSDAVAEIARSACYATAAAHAVLTGASVVLARAKGTNIVPALLTILVRFLSSAAEDKMGWSHVCGTADHDRDTYCLNGSTPSSPQLRATMGLKIDVSIGPKLMLWFSSCSRGQRSLSVILFLWPERNKSI